MTSQTVIFIVGVVVFALTVYGAVMGGGIWLQGLADGEDGPLGQRSSDDGGSGGHDAAPRP